MIISTALRPLQSFVPMHFGFYGTFKRLLDQDLEIFPRNERFFPIFAGFPGVNITILRKHGYTLTVREPEYKGQGRFPAYTSPATAIRVKARLALAEAVGIPSCLRGLLSSNTEHNVKRDSPKEEGATIAGATVPEPYLTLQLPVPVILKRRS